MEAREEFKLTNEVKEFVNKVRKEHFDGKGEGKDKGLIILSFEDGEEQNGVSMWVL